MESRGSNFARARCLLLGLLWEINEVWGSASAAGMCGEVRGGRSPEAEGSV